MFMNIYDELKNYDIVDRNNYKNELKILAISQNPPTAHF